MAKSAQYYDVDDFNNCKRKQGKCIPPRTNVLAAAGHIHALFDAKKFTWGFMGGLAMLCLGYKREMPDLHIAYDDKDFVRLKSKLESDPRVRLPTGVNPLLPFKILVWTGPEYKDQGCTTGASIELDLVPSGSYGTPAAGTLSKNLVQMSLNTPNGQQKTLKCLNIPFLMATLLSYCKVRDLWWDPRKDILYLCKNGGVEGQRMRSQLNVKQVQEYFLGTSYFSRLPVEDQRLCYRLLLNKDPPPTMAITPPAPRVSTAVQPEVPSDTEQTKERRAPRSRYRNVNGQRSSSQQFTNNVRLQYLDHLQDPRQVSHIVGVQNVNTSKPQTVSATRAAIQARRSMPDLLVANERLPTTLKSTQGMRMAPSHEQHQSVPHTMYARNRPSQPTSSSIRHDHASSESQLGYGSSFQPAHEMTTVGSGHPSQDFLETARSRSGSTKTNSTGTPVQGIQSQRGSLLVASPEREEIPRQQYFQDPAILPREGLHLVGPEGIYVAPDRPRHIAQPQVHHERHTSAPPLSTDIGLVFELDTTAPSKPTFLAELPAAPTPSPPEALFTARRRDSCSSQSFSRPSNPRTASAPLGPGSLPASLVAGGPGAHTHRPSLNHLTSSDKSMDGFPSRTNAYWYSSFVFPKPEDAEGLNACEDEGITSTYKAYRPYSVPDGHENGSLRPTDDYTHKRSVSDGSIASHDSSKLAREYQELLNFEEGYGSQ